MKKRVSRLSAAKRSVAAERFKALSHPTRLCFVETLLRGERCVCEIDCAHDLDMSTISRHLGVLRAAGLVTSRREGKKIFYRVEPDALEQCRNLLQAWEEQVREPVS